MYTNEGDHAFTPFAGNGSECYIFEEMGLDYTAIELKPAYFEELIKTMKLSKEIHSQKTIFSQI